MAKKLSLGRGLDTIFSDNSIEEAGGVRTLRLSQVEPKADQPRKRFDEAALAELSDSIRENGVLQPILVRETADGYYEIIAGERRWRASRLAGLEEIPAIVMEADDLKVAQLALIENLQRENLNPFEESAAYQALMDGFSLTQEEISRRVNKSRSAVANALRLLDLPPEVAELVQNGELSAGHGRALLGLRDRAEMLPLANRIVAEKLSVREAEAAVKMMNRKRPALPKPVAPVPDYLGALEHRATELTGRIVHISGGRRRTVTVEYQDNEDLEAVLTALCGAGIREE